MLPTIVIVHIMHLLWHFDVKLELFGSQSAWPCFLVEPKKIRNQPVNARMHTVNVQPVNVPAVKKRKKPQKKRKNTYFFYVKIREIMGFW